MRALNRRLESVYGPAKKQRLDPLDELMLTILSQSTSDTNRDRGYDALRERFPTWEAVRTAPRREVELAIRPAGLWKQKARVLQDTLEAIHEDAGALDLSHLQRLTDLHVVQVDRHRFTPVHSQKRSGPLPSRIG